MNNTQPLHRWECLENSYSRASVIVTTTYDYIIIAHDHSLSPINILSHHNLSLSALNPLQCIQDKEKLLDVGKI